MASSSVNSMRPIATVVRGKKLMEGAGVQICRTIGYGDVRVDPYLMLDELRLPAEKASAGFPDHPHRGFETCTIMKRGKMEHRDSVGNKGVICDGGVQWMTAGRGIVHSEMPVVSEGDLHGFQLWINLPAKDKMVKPRYQDIQAPDIPVVQFEGGGHARVMAGVCEGVEGPLKLRNPGLLLDVTVPASSQTWNQTIPREWNGFAYVYDGAGTISDMRVEEQHAYIFAQEGGDFVAAKADVASKEMSFLLIAGKPIGEPIVQYGPFVMNHELEIAQAFQDYRTGRLQNPTDDPWTA
uniref:Pirin n=1 Tax=Picochlorum oklahomense TaxID=249345 RepID=A0A7S1GG26_9CHLO|mmetsp:Transcript_165/g.356  ORF Transcript_165/g.356 Transcript_165/m.356 type:complete len:295 (+) Transcript_165:74-958(+)